jgi:disulfide bond formation protein DsbB
MTRTRLVAAAALGSGFLLLAAFGFQYLGGLAPCQLCLWQRWPHAAAALIGIAALMMPGRTLPLLGAVAALTTAAIAGYHAGVEQAWWAGPSSCSAGSIAGLSAEQLLDPSIVVAPVVRCTEIAWAFAGLSMAAWNMLASLGLAVLWLMAARRS